MLHIAIDARHLRDFGIGTYIRNLIRALARLDRENRYTLIARPQDLEELAGLGDNFRTAAYARADTELIHNFVFPRLLKTFHADLYHIPLNSVAWWMPRPYVVTIHDMSSLLFPERRDFRATLQEERYRRGALRAKRIITVSNSTRRDLENVLRIPPGRIRTIYSAPDPGFHVQLPRPGSRPPDAGALFHSLSLHPVCRYHPPAEEYPPAYRGFRGFAR